MSQHEEPRTLADIKAARQRITERRKAMEDRMFSFSNNDTESESINNVIFSSVKNFVFNKFLNRNKTIDISTSSNPILKTVSKFDKWGIVSLAAQFITHPTAKTAFAATRKSFIKWQLFNLGIYLVRWGYKTYKRKQQEKEITDAIIVEDK